jgi:hypothetical protein
MLHKHSGTPGRTLVCFCQHSLDKDSFWDAKRDLGAMKGNWELEMDFSRDKRKLIYSFPLLLNSGSLFLEFFGRQKVVV